MTKAESDDKIVNMPADSRQDAPNDYPLQMTSPQFAKLLKSYGATLDRDDRVLTVDAPDGCVWVASDSTSICAPWANRTQQWQAKAMGELAGLMRMGTCRVTDPLEILEIQYQLDDDTWGNN